MGVISPYKSQVKLLRESFAQALGEEGARMVDINTIDGFQGREKDIILFSCVRCGLAGQIVCFPGRNRMIVVLPGKGEGDHPVFMGQVWAGRTDICVFTRPEEDGCSDSRAGRRTSFCAHVSGEDRVVAWMM